MKNTFEQEWKLYREGGARRPFEADRPGAAADPATPFDAPPRRGELRIFADMRRPFVALLAEDRGAAGWLVVPVSPFTVPASPRERLAGERVFQLWNACVAARRFVERSWRVDALAEADVADLVVAAAKASPGRVCDGENAVAQYEREFLVAGGSFAPIVRPRDAAAPRRRWFASPALRAAAGLVICCGLAVYVANMGTKDRRAAASGGSPVLVGDAATPAADAAVERALAPEPIEEYAEEECEEEDWSDQDGLPVTFVAEAAAPAPEDAKAISEISQLETVRRAPPAPAAPAAPIMARYSEMSSISPKPSEVTVVANVKSPIVMGGSMYDVARSPGQRGKMIGWHGGMMADERRAWDGQKDSGVFAGEIVPAGAVAHAVPEAERYAEFRENEFLDPKSTPLSTFSLDVDTSSYAMMRRSVADQKRLPPRTSVRIEEFVNYFHYDYPDPAEGAPVAATCETAPCPWDPKHELARVALQARRIDRDNIPPCNLTFLVDVSGSMSWNGGIEMVKKGLSMLVGELRDEDRVAIVTYASGTSVRLPATSGSDKARILGVIDSLMAGGSTAGSAGIQLAYDEAKKNFDAKRNNRVILVTDGDFNVGISSPKELEDFIAEKRGSGIFLTVLGVGSGNYQDATMKKLANAGNGNYAYIDSVLEAKKVFLTEFGGTLQTVAKDVKLQVEFNPARVAAYRLLGYENRKLADKDFNDDKKDAGEIGAGHSMTAFYEIVPAGAGEEPVASVDPLKYQKTEAVESKDLFTVKLRWKAPDADASVLAETVCPAPDPERRGEPSEDFRFASAVAEYALLLEDSKFKGEASYGAVLERARAAKGADAEGWRAEFIRLVEAAALYARP